MNARHAAAPQSPPCDASPANSDQGGVTGALAALFVSLGGHRAAPSAAAEQETSQGPRPRAARLAWG